MKLSIRLKLSILMFFQSLVWSIWYTCLGAYLYSAGYSELHITKAYSALPLSAIIAPFVLGVVADRFFSAQKVLGALFIAGAGFLYWASSIHTSRDLFWILVAYGITFTPTIALINAIAFHQMQDPIKQFPAIRVFSTLGWIVGGLLVGWLSLESSAKPMQIAAGVSYLLGIFSFFLPDTPSMSDDKKVTVSDILGVKTLALMKDRSFATFVTCAFLIAIPVALFNSNSYRFLADHGVERINDILTLRPLPQLLLIMFIPFVFAKLGMKKMLLVGLSAFVFLFVFLAFSSGDSLLLMLSGRFILHGLYYDFFFVAGLIYVEKKAPKAVRASAQGLIVVMTLGIGTFVGARISTVLLDQYQLMGDGGTLAGYDWQGFWLVVAAMAAVVCVVFAVFFREETSEG